MKQSTSIIIISILTLTASTAVYSSSTKKQSSNMDTTKEIERKNQTLTFIEGSNQVFDKDDARQLALLAAAAHRPTKNTDTGDYEESLI